MAVVPIEVLKTKFQTGDRPTEQDFQDLIDTTAFNATALGADGNNLVTINGIENTTTFDTVDISVWRTVKYIIQMSHSPNGYYKSTEISIVFDGTDSNISEYGTIANTDNELAIINANINNGIISMTVTPTISPITVRFMRTGLKA